MTEAIDIKPLISRRPDGVWTGTAAIPVGATINVIKESIPEAPFREAALRKAGVALGGPIRDAEAKATKHAVRANGKPQKTHAAKADAAKAEDGEDALLKSLTMARRTVDGMVAEDIVPVLLQALSNQAKAVTGYALKLFKRANVSLAMVDAFTPVVAVANVTASESLNDIMKLSARSIISQLMSGDKAKFDHAATIVLRIARRLPADNEASKFVAKLIENAYGTQAIQILFALAQKSNLTLLAQVIAQVSQPQPARAG